MVGHMTLSITDGRISVETKSRGLTFAHRSQPAAVHAAPAALTNPRSGQQANAPHQGPGSARPGAHPPAASAPGVKGILARPHPQQPLAKQPPTGPATSNNSAYPSSVPSRPPTQPRQPRGLPAPQVPPGKDKSEKAPEAGGKAGAAKAPTPVPQANGKTASPVQGKEKEKTKPVSGKREKEVGGAKEDVKKEGEKEKKEKVKKEDKQGEERDASSPAPGSEAKGEVVDGERASTPGKETPEPRTRKPSLYLKGIPTVTEDEVKALFPDASKVSRTDRNVSGRTDARSRP